jgi:hypothetical protein
MGLFSLVILSVQPLTDIEFQAPISIDGKPERYSFNMTLEAINPNIIDVVVETADLDVLASAGESLFEYSPLGAK